MPETNCHEQTKAFTKHYNNPCKECIHDKEGLMSTDPHFKKKAHYSLHVAKRAVQYSFIQQNTSRHFHFPFPTLL